jgi:hypothetical protein
MYNVGDLVLIKKSAYYLHEEEFCDEEDIGKLGLVTGIQKIKDKSIFQVAGTSKNTTIFYYHEHELESVDGTL